MPSSATELCFLHAFQYCRFMEWSPSFSYWNLQELDSMELKLHMTGTGLWHLPRTVHILCMHWTPKSFIRSLLCSNFPLTVFVHRYRKKNVFQLSTFRLYIFQSNQWSQRLLYLFPLNVLQSSCTIPWKNKMKCLVPIIRSLQCLFFCYLMLA